MNIKKQCRHFLTTLAILGFATTASANEVRITANQPITLTYKIAHQHQGRQPVFSEVKTIHIDRSSSISVNLDDYAVAGVVPIAVNNHQLPSSATHFNEKEQCSMATDKARTSGQLNFIVLDHEIKCSTQGGIFG